MMPLLSELARTGFLLPETLLDAPWLGVLATFVTINTMIYLVVGMVKILPQIRWRDRRALGRRSETRSIYPDA